MSNNRSFPAAIVRQQKVRRPALVVAACIDCVVCHRDRSWNDVPPFGRGEGKGARMTGHAPECRDETQCPTFPLKTIETSLVLVHPDAVYFIPRGVRRRPYSVLAPRTTPSLCDGVGFSSFFSCVCSFGAFFFSFDDVTQSSASVPRIRASNTNCAPGPKTILIVNCMSSIREHFRPCRNYGSYSIIVWARLLPIGEEIGQRARTSYLRGSILVTLLQQWCS